MTATLYDLSYWLVSQLLDLLRPGIPAPLASLVSPSTAVILAWLVTAVIVFAASLINVIMFIWWERKLLGRFMDRRGAMHVGFAGLLQNFADGLKLFRKQPLVPRESDHLGYFFGPTAYMVSSLIILGFLPVSAGFVAGSVPLSLLLALALFSFAPLFIFVSAWSSNNKYSLIGGMRTAAQMVAYEIPIILAIVAVVLLTGSFNIATIVTDQAQYGWFAVPLFLSLLVFFIAMLAETERIPFDLPEAEAELVEGWNTEYGGILFAMTMMADYIRAVVGCYLIVLLFLGGWEMPFLESATLPVLGGIPVPMGAIWFQIKVYIVFGVFIWVRASLPRVRTDQLLQIGWKRMLPVAMAGVVLAGALVVWNWPHLTFNWL